MCVKFVFAYQFFLFDKEQNMPLEVRNRSKWGDENLIKKDYPFKCIYIS